MSIDVICDSFAVGGADGVRIFDAAECQSFLSPATIGSACTCVSWAPVKRKDKSKRSSVKRRRDILAVGTTNGSVVFYSVAGGSVLGSTEQSDGHSDKVSSLAWGSTSTLFSGGADGFTIEWDVTTRKQLSKWKCDVSGVTAMAISNDENVILTANQVIKGWDLESKVCLMTYSGHSSSIHTIKLILGTDDTRSYFVSAAKNDRFISAWLLDRSAEQQKTLKPIASFKPTDDVALVDVRSPASRDEPTFVAAVTKAGTLEVFEQRLNGGGKKPVASKLVCSVMSSGKSSVPLPILAAQFNSDNIAFIYGSVLRPGFEILDYSNATSPVTLIKEDPMRLAVSVAETNSGTLPKLKKPLVNPALTTYLTPAEHNLPSKSASKKRKSSGTTTREISMEEKLKLMQVETQKDTASRVKPPETLAILLVQGLHSQDKSIITEVLSSFTLTETVDKTVEQLPVQSVIPLIRELCARLRTQSLVLPAVKWLKSAAEAHISFLSSHPEVIQEMSSVYQLIEARTVLMDKVLRLQGKIDVLLRKVDMQGPSHSYAEQTAKLVVEDDDASDEELRNAVNQRSEEKDEWDEFEFSEGDDDESADEEEVGDEEGKESDSEAESEGSGAEPMVNGGGNESEESETDETFVSKLTKEKSKPRGSADDQAELESSEEEEEMMEFG